MTRNRSGLRTRCLAVVLATGALVPINAHGQSSVTTINNEFINVTNVTSGLLVSGPPEVARDMAIIDGAMFDAADAASGQPYAPIAYGGGAVAGVSADAAALAAGYTAMQGIFANGIWAGSGGSASVQAQVLNSINATYTSALSGFGITNLGSQCASPAGALVTVCGGVALGTTAGNANLANRGYTVGNSAALAADGSASAMLNAMSHPYTPASTNPGVFPVPGSGVAMFPQWGSVAPIGLTSAQLSTIEGQVPSPLDVTSSAYAADLLRTECQGSGTALPGGIPGACSTAGFAPATASQAKAALFWSDPANTYQAPGHWLAIADGLIGSQGLSTLQAARLSSLIGQAENDAGIAAWGTKYQYARWQPITAISNCSGWNPYFSTCDAAWTSLLATLPYPEYVGDGSAFGGAAATLLQDYFGTDAIPFSSTSETYCNGGTPLRSATSQLIVGCTVTGTQPFNHNALDTIYTTATGCTDAGGTPGTQGTLATCTINGTTYVYNPPAVRLR